MSIHSQTNIVGIGTALRRSCMLLLVYLFIGMTSTAFATPLPSLLPGFKDDVGTDYFIPNDFSVGVELIDPLEPLTSFGFFFMGNPGSTISIFDSGDLSGGVAASQVALIDFVNGIVYDMDISPGTPTPELTFAPTLADIGFYLVLGGTTIYSDPALNGGIDLFSAWQNEVDPTLWGLAFEGIGADGSKTLINVSLVGGITSAPEPSVMLLVALGGILMLVSSRRRRKI